MTPILARLLKALNDHGVGANAVEMLDAILIVASLGRTAAGLTKTVPENKVRPPKHFEQDPADSSSTNPLPERSATPEPNDLFPLMAPQPGSAVSRPQPSMPVRLAPGARPFRSQTFLRALRPFRQRIVSTIDMEPDEEATVEAWCETRQRVVVFRPRHVKRWSLLLVVDSSVGMEVWTETTNMLRSLLSGCGAFRTLRLLRLDADADVATLRSWRNGSQKGKARHIRPPSGSDSAVLVVSDFTSRAWWTGSAFQLFAQWSPALPVGLLGILPDHFWHRTALRLHPRVRLERGPGGGPLATPAPPSGLGEALPAAGLAPASFGTLPALLGHNDRPACGIGIWIVPSETDPQAMPIAEAREGSERFAIFKRIATPDALRLARFAAYFDRITATTLRLIRAAVKLPADVSLDAEVLLGGLLYIERNQLDQGYRFHRGVAELLRQTSPDSGPSEETDSFYSSLQDYLTRQRDRITGIPALLPFPREGDPLRARGGEFLKLNADLLAALGPEFEDLVPELRAHQQGTWTPEIPAFHAKTDPDDLRIRRLIAGLSESDWKNAEGGPLGVYCVGPRNLSRENRWIQSALERMGFVVFTDLIPRTSQGIVILITTYDDCSPEEILAEMQSIESVCDFAKLHNRPLLTVRLSRSSKPLEKNRKLPKKTRDRASLLNLRLLECWYTAESSIDRAITSLAARLSRPPSNLHQAETSIEQKFGHGRELSQLREFLRPTPLPRDGKPRGLVIVNIHGQDGLGKTYLATTYARRHGEDYQGVFWVENPDSVTINAKLRELAQPDGLSLQTSDGCVLRYLFENPHWLMIVDHVEDPKAFRDLKYLFSESTGHVIVTSRERLPDATHYLAMERVAREVAIHTLLMTEQECGFASSGRAAAENILDLADNNSDYHLTEIVAFLKHQSVPLQRYADELLAADRKLRGRGKDAPQFHKLHCHAILNLLGAPEQEAMMILSRFGSISYVGFCDELLAPHHAENAAPREDDAVLEDYDRTRVPKVSQTLLMLQQHAAALETLVALPGGYRLPSVAFRAQSRGTHDGTTLLAAGLINDPRYWKAESVWIERLPGINVGIAASNIQQRLRDPLVKDFPAVAIAIGHSEIRNGETEGALKTFHGVLQKHSNWEIVGICHYHIARVQHDGGELDAAAASFENAGDAFLHVTSTAGRLAAQHCLLQAAYLARNVLLQDSLLERVRDIKLAGSDSSYADWRMFLESFQNCLFAPEYRPKSVAEMSESLDRLEQLRSVGYRHRDINYALHLGRGRLRKFRVRNGSEASSISLHRPIGAGWRILHLPNADQDMDPTGGAAAMQAICQYFKSEHTSEREILAAMKLPPGRRCLSEHIQRAVAKYKLKSLEYPRQMTHSQLRKSIDTGKPVLIWIQAWSLSPSSIYYGRQWDCDHWVVAIGYNHNGFYFEDPLLRNVRGYLSEMELQERWHAKGAHGQHVMRYGIAVWQASARTAKFDIFKYRHIR